MKGKDFQAKVQFLDPKKLIPYVNNTKTHPQEQVDKIVAQIHKFGFDQPIVVNKDMVVIKGHGRRLAAIQLDMEKVPVILREDLSEHDEMALRIADNKVAESDYDDEMLMFEIGTLQRNDYEMHLTGFDDDEIKKLLEKDEDNGGFEGGPGNGEPDIKQFLLTIECKDEPELAALYQELKGRGFKCTMIADQ